MWREKAHLHDITESFELAMQYLGNTSCDDLSQNTQQLDAIIRRIGIVGEATKRLSAAFREANPQVPWREMAGMRDHVIHGYDRINIVRVYEAVKLKMPELIDELKRLRDALPDPE